ncbi:protein phosphatase 1 regulatory subunit 37 [Plakobranchus ocellatus]|uniref:Protein phosphatase 1 regulatory subunit 37 n=1 Tax=Plakobranchus ocellatus TaxID=259542 RepID=A0AAV4AW51_9GAST|nr:protein phosphatase 1 regulatory subunit 37 [Plakobranchus ocellatus]
MAEIGKDGQNLFQSIFHRAEENRHDSPSADCSNVNIQSAFVDTSITRDVEEDKKTTPNSENGMAFVKEETKSGSKQQHLKESIIPPKVSNLEMVSVSVSNGSTEHPLQPAIAAKEKESEDIVTNDNSVMKNGIVSGEVPDSSISSSCTSAIKSESTKCGKNKKGIRFPSDTFISGYHDPPDPWKDAPLCTSEELLGAYKKSCDIHATKPSAKVIQQLQSVTPDRGKREEVLSLKGEKLDQRQCETIEEILRRVQFKLLDLEACHLDDETAQALFDMIEYYESACQLNISFNKNISVRGWQACARLVRRTPSLTYLDMRSCELNDRTIPLFGRALKLGCHLTILHMENMALAGRTLVILVAALKMNETLQELFLAENKLMPSDGVQLGNLMRYNHYLGLLDLRNNHLQDVGVSHICEGLLEQGGGRGLRTLVLWNNQVNYQAMPALGKALASSETIETLNIGHNAITNEGAHLLKDGLLKTNSLRRLGLQGTRISDEGAVALAEYIADSTILLRVDLRDNDIKTGGLMALSHAMRVNTSVTRIDLDKDPKKESYMKDYAEQQARLLRDILTFQQRNIDLSLQKEEEEKAEMERKAQTAQAQAITADSEEKTGLEEEQQKLEKSTEEVNEEGKKEEKMTTSNSQALNGVEAFTIIEKSEAVGQDVDPANSPVTSPVKCDDDDDDNDGDDSEKNLQQPLPRPSHLFHRKPLHAQESLDSPVPYCAGSEEPVDLQEELPAKPIMSQEAPPAEMILSPQYVSRTMARKIFSVSRVDEQPQPSDSTQASAVMWDPLNTSAIPVVLTCPTSTTSLPVIVPPSDLTTSLSPSPKPCERAVSPSTALAQSLAQAAVSEALPVSPGANSEASQKSSPHNDNNTIPQQVIATSDGAEPLSSHLCSKEEEESEHNLLTLESESKSEQSQTCHLKPDGINTNSSSSSEDLAPSKQEVQDENSSSAPLLSPSKEPPKEASLQGSGDSTSLLIENFVNPFSPESLGNGDSSSIQPTVKSKDLNSYVMSSSLSSDALLDARKSTQVMEVHPDSPAVLEDIAVASEEGPESTCADANSKTMQPSPSGSSMSPPEVLDGVLAEDEDSWLTVGEDEAEGKGCGRPVPQQPDFFTTLSMNGLTQELASALTSLDGSPGSSPEASIAADVEGFMEKLG